MKLERINFTKNILFAFRGIYSLFSTIGLLFIFNSVAFYSAEAQTRYTFNFPSFNEDDITKDNVELLFKEDPSSALGTLQTINSELDKLQGNLTQRDVASIASTSTSIQETLSILSAMYDQISANSVDIKDQLTAKNKQPPQILEKFQASNKTIFVSKLKTYNPSAIKNEIQSIKDALTALNNAHKTLTAANSPTPTTNSSCNPTTGNVTTFDPTAAVIPYDDLMTAIFPDGEIMNYVQCNDTNIGLVSSFEQSKGGFFKKNKFTHKDNAKPSYTMDRCFECKYRACCSIVSTSVQSLKDENGKFKFPEAIVHEVAQCGKMETAKDKKGKNLDYIPLDEVKLYSGGSKTVQDSLKHMNPEQIAAKLFRSSNQQGGCTPNGNFNGQLSCSVKPSEASNFESFYSNCSKLNKIDAENIKNISNESFARDYLKDERLINGQVIETAKSICQEVYSATHSPVIIPVKNPSIKNNNDELAPFLSRAAAAGLATGLIVAAPVASVVMIGATTAALLTVKKDNFNGIKNQLKGYNDKFEGSCKDGQINRPSGYLQACSKGNIAKFTDQIPIQNLNSSANQIAKEYGNNKDYKNYNPSMSCDTIENVVSDVCNNRKAELFTKYFAARNTCLLSSSVDGAIDYEKLNDPKYKKSEAERAKNISEFWYDQYGSTPDKIGDFNKLMNECIADTKAQTAETKSRHIPVTLVNSNKKDSIAENEYLRRAKIFDPNMYTSGAPICREFKQEKGNQLAFPYFKPAPAGSTNNNQKPLDDDTKSKELNTYLGLELGAASSLDDVTTCHECALLNRAAANLSLELGETGEILKNGSTASKNAYCNSLTTIHKDLLSKSGGLTCKSDPEDALTAITPTLENGSPIQKHFSSHLLNCAKEKESKSGNFDGCDFDTIKNCYKYLTDDEDKQNFSIQFTNLLLYLNYTKSDVADKNKQVLAVANNFLPPISSITTTDPVEKMSSIDSNSKLQEALGFKGEQYNSKSMLEMENCAITNTLLKNRCELAHLGDEVDIAQNAASKVDGLKVLDDNNNKGIDNASRLKNLCTDDQFEEGKFNQSYVELQRTKKMIMNNANFSVSDQKNFGCYLKATEALMLKAKLSETNKESTKKSIITQAENECSPGSDYRQMLKKFCANSKMESCDFIEKYDSLYANPDAKAGSDLVAHRDGKDETPDESEFDEDPDKDKNKGTDSGDNGGGVSNSVFQQFAQSMENKLEQMAMQLAGNNAKLDLLTGVLSSIMGSGGRQGTMNVYVGGPSDLQIQTQPQPNVLAPIGDVISSFWRRKDPIG
jgi:hypothetical protein